MPVRKIPALHSGSGASRATTDEADNLEAELCLCIGARILLTKNLWTEQGLVNGAMGTVRDIFWREGQDTSSTMPCGLMIEFDTYSGPTFTAFPDIPTGWVSVFPDTHKFFVGKTECSRTQFPIRVGYAITVYKSQGMTRGKIVLRLPHKKDFAVGLSYVAISRAKKLTGLLFECSFDFERFHQNETEMTKDRALDVVFRSNQLI
jgi:ATP-dependent exoDNAse (exonuclease V) alpha subunit